MTPSGRSCAAAPFKEGDEVFYAGSMVRDGSDAELLAVHERIVGRAPTSLSHTTLPR